MRANFAAPVNLDQLAKLACLSKFHFLRVFDEITGATPCHFLACLRIERAKELLLDSVMSVTDICMEVGYTSLGSFSASFTELVGVSPRTFRAAPAQITPEQFFAGVQALADKQRNHAGRFLEGRLDSSFERRGYYFVGAFTKGVPQGLPHSGSIMLAPGKFRIPAPNTDAFHFLAAH
jgi:AraC-like DNA-binding protein